MQATHRLASSARPIDHYVWGLRAPQNRGQAFCQAFQLLQSDIPMENLLQDSHAFAFRKFFIIQERRIERDSVGISSEKRLADQRFRGISAWVLGCWTGNLLRHAANETVLVFKFC